MNNRFSYRILPCILVIFNLLLVFNVSGHAQSVSKKREPFEFKPVEKLKMMLENPRRIQAQQPDRVIEAFGVRNGESIADIGAGTGFYAFRLAEKVGVEGKVFAVEIQDELLKFISENMERENVKNIVLVKSSESNPNLPPQSCDKILVANSYYYFKEPVKFMSHLRKAIKPEGRVAIIDLDATKRTKKPLNKAINKHREILTADQLIDEMKQAGFQFIESFDFHDKRFFLVFRAVD